METAQCSVLEAGVILGIRLLLQESGIGAQYSAVISFNIINMM